MHLDADDLIAQFQRDYPDQYLISSLRLLVERQQREIERLTALTNGQQSFPRQHFERLEETRADLPAS